MSLLLARQFSLNCTPNGFVVSFMQSYCFKTISRFSRPLPIGSAFQYRYLQLTSKISAENSSAAASKASHKAPTAPKTAGPPASSPFKRPPPPLEPHLAFAFTISFEQLQDALNDEQRTKPNVASRHPVAQQESAPTSDPPARNLLVVDVREHNEVKQFGAMPGTVLIPRASAFLFPHYLLFLVAGIDVYKIYKTNAHTPRSERIGSRIYDDEWR